MIPEIGLKFAQDKFYKFLGRTRAEKIYSDQELVQSLKYMWFEVWSKRTMYKKGFITEGLRVRVSPSASLLKISLLVPGVPVSSRTTVLLR